MSAKNYMRFNPNNNKVLIDINNYTGNAFINAIKVRDIAHVKILTREEMKGRPHGSPDVMIMKASGETVYITRQDLVKNYRYLSGKKIVIPYMKNGVTYKIIGQCNQPYAAMLLPANMIGVYKGKNVPSGTYIVAPKSADGSIDYSNLTPINRNLFRKMFKIPNQEIIARHTGKRGAVSSRIMNRKSNKKKFGLEGTKMDGFNNNQGNMIDFNEKPKVNLGIGKEQPNIAYTQQIVNESARKTYPFRAVGVIITQDSRIEVGFMIEDTSGRQRQVPKQQVMDMCTKNLISNLTLVTQQNGTTYIRGNGISVESLPRFYA